MNWKLVALLSLFGLGMSLATVFFIPSTIEPVCWLVIFVVCAVLVAKRAPGKFFLHGLCTSLLNSVWITAGHVLFADTYAVNHAQEVAAYGSAMSLRTMMLLTGPVIGLLSGLVLGLFCFVAAKLIRRPAAA